MLSKFINSVSNTKGVVLGPPEESEGGDMEECDPGDGHTSSDIKWVLPFMWSRSAGVGVGSDV
jgi:hypothetical protein